MPTLIILTTSQSPLAIRHPHPTSPSLVLPALVHRALHTALDLTPPSLCTSACAGKLTIPHPEVIARPSEEVDGDTEVTVKLHLTTGGAGAGAGAVGIEATEVSEKMLGGVREALDALDSCKGIKYADTLLLGFQGIDYRGERAEGGNFGIFGNGNCDGAAGSSSSVSSAEVVEPEMEELVKAVWAGVDQAASASASDKPTAAIAESQTKPRVGAFGTLYLPQLLLSKLIPIRTPRANALDTPDCHTLPRSYTTFARENGIELWAGGGGEGSDPLPSAELHNILQEFAPQLAESLPVPQSLDELLPLSADGAGYEGKPAVSTRWVLSYAIFSRRRNVVKDKGYIVCADV